MEYVDIDVIEYTTQLKISRFIKENRDMNKKELAKNIQTFIEDKEKIYNSEKQIIDKENY